MTSFRLSRHELLLAMAPAGFRASSAMGISAAPSLQGESAVTPEVELGRVKRWKALVLGSLYPFVKSQQAKAQPNLSFINRQPKDLEAWKSEARAKVLEPLCYHPEPSQPKAQVVECVDKGDYICERVTFHTAPDIEMPDFVLIPQKSKVPGACPSGPALSRWRLLLGEGKDC
jgi:hypothetical protein